MIESEFFVLLDAFLIKWGTQKVDFFVCRRVNFDVIFGFHSYRRLRETPPTLCHSWTLAPQNTQIFGSSSLLFRK